MPTSTTPSISSDEWDFLATLLALAAEQFSYKSCADYPLDATDEHKAIVAAAIEGAGRSGNWGDEDASWEDYVAVVMAEDEQIVAFIDWMAAQLAARCQALAGGVGAPMTAAELALIADLLDVAREDHDEAEELGLVPYAIEATVRNRAILAAISDEASRPPGQETSVPVKAALMHFSQRCQQLSTTA